MILHTLQKTLENLELFVLMSEAHKLGMLEEETYRSYIYDMLKTVLGAGEAAK